MNFIDDHFSTQITAIKYDYISQLALGIAL